MVCPALPSSWGDAKPKTVPNGHEAQKLRQKVEGAVFRRGLLIELPECDISAKKQNGTVQKSAGKAKDSLYKKEPKGDAMDNFGVLLERVKRGDI